VLDIAKAGDRVLICSYGSGAGSDAFVLTVTKRIDQVRDLAEHTRPQLDQNKRYLSYGEYSKFRRKIRKATTV
jgi:hydroxymethylglutaryl-CoA synthase